MSIWVPCNLSSSKPPAECYTWVCVWVPCNSIFFQIRRPDIFDLCIGLRTVEYRVISFLKSSLPPTQPYSASILFLFELICNSSAYRWSHSSLVWAPVISPLLKHPHLQIYIFIYLRTLQFLLFSKLLLHKIICPVCLSTMQFLLLSKRLGADKRTAWCLRTL